LLALNILKEPEMMLWILDALEYEKLLSPKTSTSLNVVKERTLLDVAGCSCAPTAGRRLQQQHKSHVLCSRTVWKLLFP